MILCSFFVLSGCQTIPVEKYARIYEKKREKFCSVLHRNGLVVQLSYQPTEYMVSRAMVTDTSATYDELWARYAKTLFFTLSIHQEPTKKNKVVAYSPDIAAALSVVANNPMALRLVCRTDTLEPQMVTMEPAFGFAQSDVMTISFSSNQLTYALKEYRLLVRNICNELGTLDIALRPIVTTTVKLKHKRTS